MDPKSEEILTIDLNLDIDPTNLLSLQFEKMKFVSQLDVENVLSVGENEIIETNYTSKDSQTSDTNSESDTEDSTPGTESERNKDMNGNEETLSDYNLNWLFCELDLSDSDNEEKNEEQSPILRERGGWGEPDPNCLTGNQNKTNYFESPNKYDRSQIDPRYLQFLSDSSFIQAINTSHYLSLENNHSFAFNADEVFYNLTSNEAGSISYPQLYEDSRGNLIGSPESGYESSLNGSPPPISSTFITHESELISDFDDDQKFINYIIEDPAVCALTNRAVPTQLIDNKDCEEKKIKDIIKFLKNTPNELVEVSNTVANTNRNTYIVPQTKSFEDINNFAINMPPILKNLSMPKKLGYKLKEEAKRKLRHILSEENFCATEKKIFQKLIDDKKVNAPIKVIYVEEKDVTKKTSEMRTNLHHAVLKQNIEEIYCLVEIQKKYDLDLSDLNIRDIYGKTALDYAIQHHMHQAVIDYLKENTACQSVIL